MDLRNRQEVVISVTGGTCGVWQAVDDQFEVTAYQTDDLDKFRYRRIGVTGSGRTVRFPRADVGRSLGTWHLAGDKFEVMASPGDPLDTLRVRRRVASA